MVDSDSPSTPAANAAVAQTQDGSANPPPATGGGGGCSPPPPPPGRFVLASSIDGRPRVPHVSYRRRPDDPLYRPLRIYTVDPARGRTQGATAIVNVPYEPLEPGPQGARFWVKGSLGLRRHTGEGPEVLLPQYPVVNLEDRRVLIRNGHDPTPSDPVFHHQMVYAVACNTYAAFRHALGREVDWAFDNPRLTLDIHATDQALARYTRCLCEIQFGYFSAGNSVRGRMPPRGTVFLCLSHDVIAHEVTHALVDGLRARFGRAHVSHADVDAFHEAFADLVALLLRFSYGDVIRDAVRATGGQFWLHESFTHFGVQMAQAGGEEALRTIHLFGQAQPYEPTDDAYALGTVLVSAILEALVVVYQRKIDPFIRLAGIGHGAPGNPAKLSMELVEVMTHMASRLASHFLSICIRALDYCPPAGVDFGDYLRAMITADRELVPDDLWNYREALIDSFVARRIYPRRVLSMSEDALGWDRPRELLQSKGLSFARLRFAGDPASPFGASEMARRARVLGELVTGPDVLQEFGLVAADDVSLGGDRVDLPVIESIRSARRIGPDGQVVFDLVCEVTQLRHVLRPGAPDMAYWGGSTIIVDPDGVVRYVIRKSVTDRTQIERKRLYEELKDTIIEVKPTASS